MQTARNGDVELAYAADGEGPTLVFCGDVGLGAWQWGYLRGALGVGVETLTFDYRGTGDSDAPAGPYTLADLRSDLDAVLRAHGVDAVHLVGAGFGGQVAVEYARRSGQVETLSLIGTPVSPADVDAAALERLRAPGDGRDALRASLRAGFSAAGYEAAANAGQLDRIVGWRREDDAGPTGWEGQTAALLESTLADLYEVTRPALVFQGIEDAIVDPTAGERLAADLPRGDYRAVEAGHLAAVECARPVADELLAFVDAQTDGDRRG